MWECCPATQGLPSHYPRLVSGKDLIHDCNIDESIEKNGVHKSDGDRPHTLDSDAVFCICDFNGVMEGPGKCCARGADADKPKETKGVFDNSVLEVNSVSAFEEKVGCCCGR